MFKNHPKGLFVLALANMGERFGYYTMLAIFVLFMQAKFGFTAGAAGNIYGIFLAAVYFLPLIGGIIADKLLGYGKTITLGIVVMFFGYLLLAIPTGVDLGAKVMMFGALALIALGTGFFKGNLQALVGNLYDDPKYSSKRDLAFSIFYMCINVGAFFAPSAAEAVSNHFLGKDGFTYNNAIPALAHQMNNGTIDTAGVENLTQMAAEQGYTGTDLAGFGSQYIESLSSSYNFGFGVACLSLIVSIAIFLGFRKFYKAADKTEKEKAKAGDVKDMVQLTAKQTKDRLVALGLVFAVVIFFWMAFHQNGLTLTYFAKSYTVGEVSGFSRFGFSLLTLLPFAVGFYGLLNIFQSKAARSKFIAGVVMVVGFVVAWFAYSRMDATMAVTPPKFQQFNPFFIILLTPVAVGFFSWLNKKGKEPLAPRKIGIGMMIAALGFLVMVVASLGLPTPEAIKSTGDVSPTLVSTNWLVSTYFVLTIAELFLSPMGISFVSKVAPPKYKGLAQGGWLAATAVGNYLVAIIGYLWGGMQLWMLWAILVTLCLLSAAFLFSQMKKLERVTKEA
jgi:POT family proton-dependent oligopeptide transporter